MYKHCSPVLRVTVRCKSRLCFSFLFLYVPLIECLLISFSIGVVFTECLCKVVRARKVLFSAHVDVIVLLVVEDALKCLQGSNSYRAWRKSGVLVCIVRRFNLKVFVEYSASGGVA